MIVEIAGQRLRRSRIDRAGLRGVEFDVVHRTLLILEAAECFDQHFRRFQTGGDRAGDLAPQRHPPLVGEITLFGEAELPDRGLEASGIECAADTLEIGIVEDHAPRFLVKGGFRNGLLQQLAVEAEGPGLIGRQRAAELAADLLQLIGIDLTEFIDRNLGAADRGQCRLAETLEDVVDPPDPETDDQDAHHHGHDDLAEPV